MALAAGEVVPTQTQERMVRIRARQRKRVEAQGTLATIPSEATGATAPSLSSLHLESLEKLVRSITIGPEELRYAVVVSTSFQIKESAVSGYLAIVLGVSSLDRLLRAIENWENSPLS